MEIRSVPQNESPIKSHANRIIDEEAKRMRIKLPAQGFEGG